MDQEKGYKKMYELAVRRSQAIPLNNRFDWCKER